jgi:TorA maturation chaperone TorD
MLTDEVRRLAARADLARLLAASYYEPGPEFAEEGLFASISEAADAVDPTLGEGAHRLQRAFSGVDRQELLIDYVRLFHGPPKALAQPYSSVWLSKTTQTVMQDSTVAVLDLYREAGFEMAEDFRDLPDHLSVELECLYVLLFREAQALQSGNVNAAYSAATLRGRLLREHLGLWVPAFAEATVEVAETDVYLELAELTRRSVELELRSLD